jgi:hypothetical protein
MNSPRVIHTALVDHENNVLGCIDQLDKNSQLIRLDGGRHWSHYNSVENYDRTASSSTPK